MKNFDFAHAIGVPMRVRSSMYAFDREFYTNDRQSKLRKVERDDIIVPLFVLQGRPLHEAETCMYIMTSGGVGSWLYFQTQRFHMLFINL